MYPKPLTLIGPKLFYLLADNSRQLDGNVPRAYLHSQPNPLHDALSTLQDVCQQVACSALSGPQHPPISGSEWPTVNDPLNGKFKPSPLGWLVKLVQAQTYLD